MPKQQEKKKQNNDIWIPKMEAISIELFPDVESTHEATTQRTQGLSLVLKIYRIILLIIFIWVWKKIETSEMKQMRRISV